MVIADPKSQLNLPDNFNNLNVDTIFSRGENLRKPKQERKRVVRWGAKSIYEGNNQLDPFSPSSKELGGGIKSPEVAPQFELRF